MSCRRRKKDCFSERGSDDPFRPQRSVSSLSAGHCMYTQSPAVILRGLAYAPPLLHVTSLLAAELSVTQHSASLDLTPGTICHRNRMPSLILNFSRNCSRLTILSRLLSNSCNALANNFILGNRTFILLVS